MRRSAPTSTPGRRRPPVARWSPCRSSIGTQVLVPAGVCNGFQALADATQYLYCFDAEWVPGMAGVAVHPLDPALGIEWPHRRSTREDRSQLSAKDAAQPTLAEVLGLSTCRSGRVTGARPNPPLRSPSDVPEGPHHQGLQVLRRRHDPGDGAGRHGGGRTERQRQVQRRRRDRLGAGRPGAERGPVARRWTTSSSPAPRSGRRSAGPRWRSRSTTAPGILPIEFAEVTIARTLFRDGRQRVLAQRRPVPAARHPGAPVRHRRRPPAARDHLARARSTPCSTPGPRTGG